MNEISENERGLFEHYKFEVDKGQTLLRVDKFLGDKIEGYSRNKIQTAADNGQLFANGTAIKSNYKVKPGDIITIELDSPKQELKIIAQDIPLNIVYEDEHLMVVNKPAGMVVHPGVGNYSGTLVNAIAWYWRDSMQFDDDDPRLGLVHRIDKDTSGLLVIAKSERARVALADQFFHKTSERTYIAVVWGRLKEAEGEISGYMGRSPKDRTIRAMVSEDDGGKWSLTHYKVLEELSYVSVVECKLETGRTHQIRVHFKSIGHPLFNDETYGGNQILRGTTFNRYKQFVATCFDTCPRQALHAKTLGFKHPVSGEFMQFDSKIPTDMQELMQRWREYTAQR
ncbi:MAG: RluA family pseudouridine synthase [Bacteroidales bacterium]|jgi:23S rRNA pseudouridine1911/1915/1917 synthase|nr:RluA family pseudouridine synthase [Bacteroidales bacterium]